MKLRNLIFALILATHASSQEEEPQEGITHLVPCAGLHGFDHSWDYDSKLRKVLVNPKHDRFKAFALVRTGPGRPEYCVYLLEADDGKFTAESREASRHIWYEKQGGDNPVKVLRASIPGEKGKEIAQLWEKMLRGVRQPQPEDVTHVILDGASTYYACFVLGDGILAGETHNFSSDGGDLGKLADLTRWMHLQCVLASRRGSAPGVNPPQKEDAEQGVAPQSATRSELDSEGGDQPQPESEARSR